MTSSSLKFEMTPHVFEGKITNLSLTSKTPSHVFVCSSQGKISQARIKTLHSKPLSVVNKPTRADSLVKAIEGTIQSYNRLGADPKSKSLRVRCNIREAIELFLTFKNQIQLTFLIDGDECYIYEEGGTKYLANSTRIDTEVRNGAPHETATSNNTIRITTMASYTSIVKNVEKRREAEKIQKHSMSYSAGMKAARYASDYAKNYAITTEDAEKMYGNWKDYTNNSTFELKVGIGEISNT